MTDSQRVAWTAFAILPIFSFESHLWLWVCYSFVGQQPPFVASEPHNVHPFHAKRCRGENLMWWDIFIGFSKLWPTHPPTLPAASHKSGSAFCKVQYFLSRQLITFHGLSLLFQFTEQTCSKYSVAFQKISKPRGKFCEEWQILSILLIGFEHSRDVLQDMTQIKILIIRLFAYL